MFAEFAAKVTPENGKGSVIQFDIQDSVLLKRILWFVRYRFKIKNGGSDGTRTRNIHRDRVAL